MYFPLAALFVCLCCATALRASAAQPAAGFRKPYGYGQGSGAGETPAPGICSNAGASFSDNPYHGWPLDYEPNNWAIVTFYFCASYPDGTPHWGIDFGAPIGSTALVMTERAVVIQADDCGGSPACWNYGMGRYAQIEAQTRAPDYDNCVARHGGDLQANECWVNSGWLATYMHLDVVSVVVGQILYQGDAIGETGNTGNSTGPHLHYQINSPSFGAIDPAPTLAR